MYFFAQLVDGSELKPSKILSKYVLFDEGSVGELHKVYTAHAKLPSSYNAPDALAAIMSFDIVKVGWEIGMFLSDAVSAYKPNEITSLVYFFERSQPRVDESIKIGALVTPGKEYSAPDDDAMARLRDDAARAFTSWMNEKRGCARGARARKQAEAAAAAQKQKAADDASAAAQKQKQKAADDAAENDAAEHKEQEVCARL